MQLYLAVSPQEVRDASRYTRVFAHAAYRIGPESTLLRRDLLLDSRGGLLCVSDFDAPVIADPEKLAAAVLRECSRRSYTGAVLDFEAPPSADRAAFVGALAPLLSGSRRMLLIPERYAGPAHATVLINTAISGGNFRSRVQEAQNRYGQIVLDVQRLIMDFTLPSPSGEGRPLQLAQLQAITQAQRPAVFFSPDLCARYFTYPAAGSTHFILFDDAETISQKLRTGSALGVRTALLMYPEVSDLLEKLYAVSKQKKAP
ncbi:MAG: hypothetical protein LKJ86_08850 [Oscillibacter sp.]|nr:hypothetical protein [Oscillibacter sp.]